MFLTLLQSFSETVGFQWFYRHTLAGPARLSGTVCSMRTACSVHTTAVRWEKEVVVQSRHLRWHTFKKKKGHLSFFFALRGGSVGKQSWDEPLFWQGGELQPELKRPQGVTEKFIRWRSRTSCKRAPCISVPARLVPEQRTVPGEEMRKPAKID